MRAALVIVLLAISATISYQKSTENSVETSGLPYYDLLDCRLNAFASVMERLAELIQKNDAKLEDLISNVEEKFKTLSENQHKTAERISVLEENNSRISNQIDKLESSGAEKLKSLDNRIDEMKRNLSAVSHNIQNYNIDDLKKNVQRNNSRILQQIEILETAGALNMKSMDNQINQIKRSFSAVSDNITKSDSRIAVQIEKLESAVTQNQKSLDNQIGILQKITELESARVQNQQSLDEMKRSLTAVSDNIKIINNRIQINDCKTAKKSGVYLLEDSATTVYCEMTTLGGGWIIIQQRLDLNHKFNRNWNEFRDGFGVFGEKESFWLGNEAVHQITNGGDYELAIELRYGNGPTKEARYSHFRLAGEDDKYRLTVGGHSGSLVDQFSKNNNMKFSTYDNDNNRCASMFASGWWYTSECGLCDLNNFIGAFWRRAFDYSFFGEFSRMMIRRK